MQVEKLNRSIEMTRYLKALGVDEGGITIMASKATCEIFYIRNLHVGAANILKQDALSIGADLAVPRGTVTAQQSHVDAILIATKRQMQTLAKKELAQPFGLKKLAQRLQEHLKAHKPAPARIMGVINANEDSFFEGSRFQEAVAVKQVEQMINDGAQIIDLGAVSSRPGAAMVEAKEELDRIKPVIDSIYTERLFEKAEFSIDSYTPEVISYALERGFSIVNDITGLQDDKVCELTARYGATAVIMHMQGTPQTMQDNPTYEALLSDITAFFEERLEKAERFGINKTVLDVGIGFGKRLGHNLELITHMEHFLKLGSPLLVGASRKSMIDKIIPSTVEERLPGTLALHLKAVENGAEIVRAHDVKEHRQALTVAEALGRV